MFKNPAKALQALRAHYGQGIWLIQKELHMLPLTPYTYYPYAMNGWAPTSGKQMRDILSALKGCSFIGDNITLRSSLAEDQLPALDALADAIAAEIKN